MCSATFLKVCSQSTILLLCCCALASGHTWRPLFGPRSGELRTQKLKSHLLRTQSLKVLPLKSGLGQHMAMHATLTARYFFIANFSPSGPFTCVFFQNLSRFLLCWLWLTHGSCVGPQNKIGHPTRCRFQC